jgi:hypothetical protein
MEVLVILGRFFVGLGVLLLGCAAIWLVAIHSEKEN